MKNIFNENFIYFNIENDNIVLLSTNDNVYTLDLTNNLLSKQDNGLTENNLLERHFNSFDSVVLQAKDILINKSNPNLLNVVFSEIKEDTVFQVKNISAKSFSLDSNFLVNKVDVLASNKLELAYFKKFILTNELRGLNVKYQELLYLLKNKYVKYFQININNILISKITDKIIQIAHQDADKDNFQSYEIYSYYLNIDDFFLMYEHFINEEFYKKICDVDEQRNKLIYLKALESNIVKIAVFKDENMLAFKYQNQLHQLKLN